MRLSLSYRPLPPAPYLSCACPVVCLNLFEPWIKILSRLHGQRLPMPSLFRDKGTRHDQKRLARVFSPANVPRLPCRPVPPRPCLQPLYLYQPGRVPPSMQRPVSVPHRRRSPEHKRVCQRNELTAAGVAPCLPLFS